LTQFPQTQVFPFGKVLHKIWRRLRTQEQLLNSCKRFSKHGEKQQKRYQMI
jgi:hypothetical protein